jgi:hypothetical protein
MHAIAEPASPVGFLTQVRAAKFFSVTDRTIRRWEKLGMLQGRRVRGVKLYSIQELRELVNGTANLSAKAR